MMGGCRGFYDGGNILNFDLDSNCILQNVPFLINQTRHFSFSHSFTYGLNFAIKNFKELF
jgi:hypothetical protein